jgi:hypothetical protein
VRHARLAHPQCGPQRHRGSGFDGVTFFPAFSQGERAG